MDTMYGKDEEGINYRIVPDGLLYNLEYENGHRWEFNARSSKEALLYLSTRLGITWNKTDKEPLSYLEMVKLGETDTDMEQHLQEVRAGMFGQDAQKDLIEALALFDAEQANAGHKRCFYCNSYQCVEGECLQP